jgi:hypothetical protein
MTSGHLDAHAFDLGKVASEDRSVAGSELVAQKNLAPYCAAEAAPSSLPLLILQE